MNLDFLLNYFKNSIAYSCLSSFVRLQNNYLLYFYVDSSILREFTLHSLKFTLCIFLFFLSIDWMIKNALFFLLLWFRNKRLIKRIFECTNVSMLNLNYGDNYFKSWWDWILTKMTSKKLFSFPLYLIILVNDDSSRISFLWHMKDLWHGR